jgi:hypothetical protein
MYSIAAEITTHDQVTDYTDLGDQDTLQGAQEVAHSLIGSLCLHPDDLCGTIIDSIVVRIERS